MHDLIAPSINFFALVFGLVYFLRKPSAAALKQRAADIQAMALEAEKVKAESERR